MEMKERCVAFRLSTLANTNSSQMLYFNATEMIGYLQKLKYAHLTHVCLEMIVWSEGMVLKKQKDIHFSSSCRHDGTSEECVR